MHYARFKIVLYESVSTRSSGQFISPEITVFTGNLAAADCREISRSSLNPRLTDLCCNEYYVSSTVNNSDSTNELAYIKLRYRYFIVISKNYIEIKKSILPLWILCFLNYFVIKIYIKKSVTITNFSFLRRIILRIAGA